MRPLLLLVPLLAACPGTPPVGAGPARPELQLDRVTIRVFRNNEPLLLARGGHVELQRSTGAVFATGTHFDFLADGLRLDAPELKGNLETLAFDASGAVSLASTRPPPAARFLATTRAAHFEGREGARGVATGAQPLEVRGEQDGRPFSLSASAFLFDVAEQRASFEPVRSRLGAP